MFLGLRRNDDEDLLDVGGGGNPSKSGEKDRKSLDSYIILRNGMYKCLAHLFPPSWCGRLYPQLYIYIYI